MKTVGITIGLGGAFPSYAKQAVKHAQQCLELDEFHILGEEHAKYIPKWNWPYPGERACYLKFLAPNFVDADRYVYFDCDLMFLSRCLLAEIYETEDFCAVRDRVFRQDVRDCETRLGIKPRSYYNSGLLIYSRKHVPTILEMAEQYQSVPKTYWDQCVFNKFLPAERFIPRWYNCMDWFGESQQFAPYGWHSAASYDHYNAGTRPTALHAMSDFAPTDDNLEPDGFTKDGNLWLYSEGQIVIHSPDGTILKGKK